MKDAFTFRSLKSFRQVGSSLSQVTEGIDVGFRLTSSEVATTLSEIDTTPLAIGAISLVANGISFLFVFLMIT